jgi:8-oxo-dGTP diphosphatase / 2-hydroxy-dATP diphosphatase
MKTKLTLVIIHKNSKVLLGMKKRGFGKGRWNGFGGKLNHKETVIAAAKREVLEEVGIEINNFKLLGELHFRWLGKKEILEVHIFKATEYSGKPAESEEMKPRWFSTDKIPFKKMWPDDIFWFKYFLKDNKFKGSFVFNDSDQIISHWIKKVEK